mmetsp:Transcript_262/g.468  ORF Transcript_262/g.468 Transcript_262/m.468 type:complete len:84 (+) Transcript_262:57-308(+)
MFASNEMAAFQPTMMDLSLEYRYIDNIYIRGNLKVECSEKYFVDPNSIKLAPESSFHFSSSCKDSDKLRFLLAIEKGTNDEGI